MRLHHVQVSCPPGDEPEARRFYGDGLGLTEVDKPAALAGRGGAWFRSIADDGTVTAEIHVGVEADFVPAGKAHPALVLASLVDFEACATRLQALGFAVDWSERTTFDGFERFHTRDGSGNRVEILVSAVSAGL